MDIFQELGVRKFINAHDTITKYGGSRIPVQAFRSIEQAARYFVDLGELQSALDKRLAELTGNEDAYVSNGAAGALMTAAAVCLCDDDFSYSMLPEITGTKDEFIVMRGQYNIYGKSIMATGAKIVEIGCADETLGFELEGVLSEKTAGVIYYDNLNYERASLDMETTIEIAHRKGVPVIVDAAANLPPAENLHAYTDKGADIVIFSGGKTLMGPQGSGLVVGKRIYLERMRRFGFPEHGICRCLKVSKESMIGLYEAVKIFLSRPENAFLKECESKLSMIEPAFFPLKTKIVNHGSVGQTYPRLFVDFRDEQHACEFVSAMYDNCVFVGREKNWITISPINIEMDEINLLIEKIRIVLEEKNG